MPRNQFRQWLLSWYAAHARKLPWRESRDPYRVWLSEIMLQQTRVAAVIEHYHEFLRRFPTVEKLAAAREASVLAAWSGLGYYRRARMLHAAAKVIVRELHGQFPTTAEGWRTLPGIGRYTAAAIASIAFGEPAAVVDGNVERVLQRIFGHRLAGEELWRVARELLDRRHPGEFNQAMMELGATVCTPRAPACLTCPVIKLCAARGEMPKPARTPRQTRQEIHYALAWHDGAVFLVERPHNARLLAGMWELPEAKAAPAALKEEQIPRRSAPRNDKRGSISGNDKPGSGRQLLFTLRHSITVTDYTVRVWRCPAPSSVRGKWIAAHRLGRIPITGLTRKILQKAGVIAFGPEASGLTTDHWPLSPILA
ncbi:MAG TPA: A/G-specific adenine glycosylase [Candidatus Acidoferrales bacterium]|nr:A/G-specific adenine glycosylase [Candidatus Acidoferrales bacterium]